MPTQSLLQCIESPDGHVQDVPSGGGGASGAPEPASSMTPHGSAPEEAACDPPPSCMFCEQTFARQDELGPHVLTQHATTFYEPAVLRVEAEFRIPGERARAKESGAPAPREEVRRCVVCGLAWRDAAELEAHMRKHKDYFTFCCSVCGRRFREPWFLKAHMKTHAKAGSRSRAPPDPEAPVTVNGVVQDPPAEAVVTSYKMCMVCGFFFPDHQALVDHSKVHNRELDPGEEEEEEEDDKEEAAAAEEEKEEEEAAAEEIGGGASVTKKTFLLGLGLLPQPHGQPERSSRWIPQLDPFSTYQAWQLATRGKIAVGPNTGKDASTDNEDGSSDKDECAVLAPEPPPVAAGGPETRRRCLMQRVKEKERPTSCEDCRRTFRTYHQLVLHSRIHKRERSGEESPTSAERKARLEQAEEGCEDAFGEAVLPENPAAGEDGLGQSKARSKECHYCGKSFRSSYYLTIHLRTHTGEKPYKCVYCDYAAAQKTSLKYHLDRHHKDRRHAGAPSRPSASPVRGKPGDQAGIGACGAAAAEDGKAGNPLLQTSLACQKPLPTAASPLADDLQRPVPVDPERDELPQEDPGAPLNLSLKVSVRVLPGALVPAACQSCAYKSFYPEVLTMHRRLVHKDTPVKKSGSGGAKPPRLTGCPPALRGRDVAPLPALGRPHPRRTTSPLRPPAKAGEKPPVGPAPAPKRSPRCPAPQETQQQGGAAPPPQQPPGRSLAGSRAAPASQRSYAQRGAAWHADAARLCLSSQFGPLPPMDFGEPSSKRLKFVAAPLGEADAGLLRGPLMPSRGGRTASQPPPDSAAAAAVGGGLDGDWSVMNLLGSCPAAELASLYRSAPAHAGLANPRAGGITVLYQHLPPLPALPRRDPAALFPHQRYGAADKTA